MRILSAVLLSILTVFVSYAADEPTKGHRILASQDGKQLAIVDAKGEIEWSYKVGPVHDAHLLPNGNLLFQTDYEHIIEVTPDKDKKVVWSYDSKTMNGNGPTAENPKGRPVQVHAFQRLADGNTMIVESGPCTPHH